MNYLVNFWILVIIIYTNLIFFSQHLCYGLLGLWRHSGARVSLKKEYSLNNCDLIASGQWAGFIISIILFVHSLGHSITPHPSLIFPSLIEPIS